jgi:hypothetical protein
MVGKRQMIAGERKQGRAGLLELADKRSLTSLFWSSRDCRYFVEGQRFIIRLVREFRPVRGAALGGVLQSTA